MVDVLSMVQLHAVEDATLDTFTDSVGGLKSDPLQIAAMPFKHPIAESGKDQCRYAA